MELRQDKNLFKKMLLIENLGALLYEALSAKSRDTNQKDIYTQLARNEHTSGTDIKEELARLNIHHSSPLHTGIVVIAKYAFALMPLCQLEWILKKALKKRIYSRWFACYHESNQELWDKLLQHETMQCALLKIPPCEKEAVS